MRLEISITFAIFASFGAAADMHAQESAAGLDLSAPLPVEAEFDRDAANRTYLLEFLERDQIQAVATAYRLDLEGSKATVTALEGDRLANAAQQARIIDQQIGASDTISMKATTLIIILLVFIILILVL